MKKTWFSVMLCVLMLLTACTASNMDTPELLEPVGAERDVVRVQRGEISEVAAHEFHVVPKTYEVLYTADGTIAEICVIYGQKVQTGDVLLRLDVEAEKEQLEELDHQIEYTGKNHALTLQMLQLDVDKCAFEMNEARNYANGTKREQEKIDEYNRVKAAYEQEEQRQALEMKQLREQRSELAEKIASSELTAPVDGSVVYIGQDANETARAGSVGMLLAVDELLLKGDYLSEPLIEAADEITAMVGGVSCEVEYLPLPEAEYVSLLLSGAQMHSQFAFVNGAPASVQAGDYALVLVKTRRRENVLYLPINALERDAQGDYVYLSDGNGGRERVNITVGSRTSIAAEIVSGLQEGDEVYVP